MAAGPGASGRTAPRRRAAERGSGRGGFVLVSVLGIAALATALVASLLLLSRAGLGDAALRRDDLVIEALLGAGVETAAYQLFAQQVSAAGLDGQEIRFDAGRVTLAVTAQRGLVDLNGADPALLAAAYAAARGRSMRPDEFAGLVADWRDGDDEDHRGGSERDRYAAAGLAYGPANTRFARVADLRLLPGLAAEDVVALQPFVTVFNPSGRIDLGAAPRAVLEILPGVGPATVSRLIEMRRRLTEAVAQQMLELIGDSARFAGAGGPAAFEVTVAVTPRAGRPRRAAVMLIPGVAEGSLYHVAEWTDR
ncbi:type II secretion system minor pseudopilin [Methylobrevis albus]|uniref:General secretion pathway protein GspK n=1 Tax=Methylobrevis albus TaxID=2793297 RepID=A0A931I008_9HYPH|nr:type II secretion system protein GspK [Methylobrevis albus]MBH0237857.1 general secretion pathway protein GspK [Methylobrevis albus]